MYLPKESIHYAPRRRMFAGAVALLFLGVSFAVPLYAALTICAMSCCEHEQSAHGAVATPTPCATECAIRADEATAAPPPAIATEKRGEQRIALLGTASVFTHRSAALMETDHRASAAGHRAGDAPLNVLHSVFRI